MSEGWFMGPFIETEMPNRPRPTHSRFVDAVVDYHFYVLCLQLKQNIKKPPPYLIAFTFITLVNAICTTMEAYILILLYIELKRAVALLW